MVLLIRVHTDLRREHSHVLLQNLVYITNKTIKLTLLLDGRVNDNAVAPTQANPEKSLISSRVMKNSFFSLNFDLCHHRYF